MQNKFSNVRRLLKDSPNMEMSDYDNFVKNARDLVMEEDIYPKSDDIIRTDSNAEYSGIRSEPNVLQKLISNLDPTYQQKINEQAKYEKLYFEDRLKPFLNFDRKAINNKIIKEYLEDKNPAALQNVKQASNMDEVSETNKVLTTEAYGLLPESDIKNIKVKTTKPEFKDTMPAGITELRRDDNKQATIELFSDTENIINNLNTPFHEYLHTKNIKGPRSDEIISPLNEEKDLANKLIKDNKSHINLPITDYVDNSVAGNAPESAVYFNRLKKLINNLD